MFIFFMGPFGPGTPQKLNGGRLIGPKKIIKGLNWTTKKRIGKKGGGAPGILKLGFFLRKNILFELFKTIYLKVFGGWGGRGGFISPFGNGAFFPIFLILPQKV